MAKSIIVYGVPGGKTRFEKRIAEYFGLIPAVYCNDAALWHEEGFLYLSRNPIAHPHTEEYSRSFQSVADEINAAIPLTDWQSGPPPMVGEWNASTQRNIYARRWWNGDAWSVRYFDNSKQITKNGYAALLASDADRCSGILWRGLSQEPIKVTECDNLGVKP